MKKYIYSLFTVLFVAATMASCTNNDGVEPGNDSNPAVTLYQYKVGSPYNVDNDVSLRFATNSMTTDVYYLAEKTADKKAKVTSMGEEGYWDHVMSTGIKLKDISGASNVDVVLTGLFGEYTITAVAVGGDARMSANTVFTGMKWSLLGEGYYTSAMFGVVDMPVDVYQEEKLGWYKLPSVFTDDKDMIIKIKGANATVDKQDVYTHPDYGAIFAAGGGTLSDGKITMSLTYTAAAGSFGAKEEALILPKAK